MTSRWRLYGGLTALCLAACLPLAACGNRAVPPATESAAVAAQDAEWPSFGRTGAETHYSPLGQVNGSNVDRLGLAWYYDLPAENSMTAPVMAGGRLFVTTGHSHIRALDAATGKLLWDYDSGSRERSGYRLRYGYGAKGLAYWNGRVFTVTHEGRVIALDAGDGTPLWEARTLPEQPDGRYVDGPPRVFDGKLVIGHGGADTAPVRGYVDCFDAMTGKKLWRFYTIPGDPAQGFESEAMAMAARTWGGDWWRHGGGGTVWNAISYDPQLRLFYLGTGNGYPYNHQARSDGVGDNLFLDSVVAVDADSGAYVWHYQETPAEQSDYTATMDMTLATLDIDGRQRKVLMQAPKNGFFYVIDRTNGELLSAEPFATVTWATRVDLRTGRPLEVAGYRRNYQQPFELRPAVTGAHSWQPQSYSPRTGLVYIPVIERASLIQHTAPDTPREQVGMGIGGSMNLDAPGTRRSYLKAWDPLRQRPAWVVETPGDWPGGTLATGGDLVFQGRIDGEFVAYDARDGRELWHFDAGVPVVAPPISYAVNGRQYVTVLTGSGASGGGIFATGVAGFRTDYRMPRRILTFALDGATALPPAPPPPLALPADPAYRADPELERAGALQYLTSGCLVCHGTDAVAGGSAPDLRRSPLVRNRETFHAIVRQGVLVPLGMPQFPELRADQVEAIRAYLRSLQNATGPAAESTLPGSPT